MKYAHFSDLPNHIKKRVSELNQPDIEKFVAQKIPALSNRSILEVMSEIGGEQKVVQYLGRVEVHFF